MERLRRVIAKSLPSAAVVEEIQHGYTAIHDLASRLGAITGSAADVAQSVAQWTARLDDTLDATAREQQWRAHFRKIVRAFGARLFTCYDHAQLPRTNNDLEQALRALSTRERRCTGRKHVGPKLVRIHGLVGAAALLINDATAADQIAALPPDARRGFRPRRQRSSKPRGQGLAFRRAPNVFLKELEIL